MANPADVNKESSKSLRALIEHKRKNGQMQAALTLAKLGRRILLQSEKVLGKDEVSRKAFELYLEIAPDDMDVRSELEDLNYLNRSRRNSNIQYSFFFASLTIIALAIFLLNHYYFSHSTASTQQKLQASATQNLSDQQKKNSPLVASSNLSSQTSSLHNSSSTQSEINGALLNQAPIVIHAVGDVVLGTDYPKSKLPNEEQQKKIIELSQSLNRADLVFGNLEGVLCDKGVSTKDTTQSGYFSFRMPTAYAHLLKDMGFNVLSVANNHALDFGDAGLQSTIKALNDVAIQVSGTVSSEPAQVQVRDTKIAFLSYSYLSTVMPMDNETQIKIDIANAKQKADLVFVSVHAGGEGEGAAGTPEKEEFFLNEYRGNIHKFAEFVIDSGASGVFGHGPHVIRPFEIYKDKPIFYSLGNFVGFRTLSTKGKLVQSIVAEVKFNTEGKFLSAGIIPLKMDDFGIPSADYSLTTLSNLDDLLNENLEKRPLLSLKISSIKTSVTNSSYSSTQTINSQVNNSENSSTH